MPGSLDIFYVSCVADQWVSEFWSTLGIVTEFELKVKIKDYSWKT